MNCDARFTYFWSFLNGILTTPELCIQILVELMQNSQMGFAVLMAKPVLLISIVHCLM